MMAARKIDPIHGTFGESDFVSNESLKIDAGNHGALATLAGRGARAMKETTATILFQRRGANRQAVEFNGCA